MTVYVYDTDTALDRRQIDPFYTFLGPNPDSVVAVLVSLIILGQCLLLLLLCTFMFSSRVKPRNPTLINLIFISVLAGGPALLLFYSGNLHNPDPAFSLCLVQAALKHGTDTMFVMAPFALVSELYMSTKTWSQRASDYRRLVLLCLPYVTFIVFATLTAGIGATHPEAVRHQPEVLWCDVYTPGLGTGIGLFGVGVVVCTITFQVLTAIALRAAWRRAALDPENEPTRRHVSANGLLFRLAAYTIVQVAYLIIAMVNAATGTRTNLLLVAFEACMPFGVFLVYGLSTDVLRAWTRTYPKRPTISAPMPNPKYTLPPSLDPEAPPFVLPRPPPVHMVRPEALPTLARAPSVASTAASTRAIFPGYDTASLGYADPRLSGTTFQSGASGKSDPWRWSVYTGTEKNTLGSKGAVPQRATSLRIPEPTAKPGADLQRSLTQ